MPSLAIGLRPREARWPCLLAGLLAVALLLALPGQSYTGSNNNNNSSQVNALEEFLALEMWISALTTPGQTLTVGQFELLVFEFFIDQFLLGQIPNDQLMQLEIFEGQLNKALGI
jgi:hypothetical protein